jgi:hypothetical protein
MPGPAYDKNGNIPSSYAGEGGNRNFYGDAEDRQVQVFIYGRGTGFCGQSECHEPEVHGADAGSRDDARLVQRPPHERGSG